jgi:2,4-dienoyl-CoA reductase-like NADH-dependent reductase (Old Yellow Enzyme family)/thioredoxin reductase
MEFTKLFQPGVIGGVQIRNRIVMAPMGTHFAEADGSVGERVINYYVARALGGAGAIMVEASFPTFGRDTRIYLADDRFIPGLKRLSDAIHGAGATAFIQIHPGRGRFDTVQAVSCAKLRVPGSGAMARALRTEEVEQRVAEFGEAALRARKSGFDGIEVHGGHGYLVADFLSSRTNKRTDKYGGSPENRARFAVELIRAAKERAGKDYPVLFRLSVDEVGRHLQLKDAIAVSQMLEKAGANAIDITSAGADNYERVAAPYYLPLGYNARYAQRIRKSVGIPVSTAGRIDDPYVADEIIRRGKADFVTLGRALITDPEFPKKAAEGRVGDIRKCIACCSCIDVTVGKALKCTVNAAVGREGDKLGPAPLARRILVVGGGPGGMEAARVAALRGHNVRLWESGKKLGGQVNLAALPPYKEPLTNVIQYLGNQLKELGVTIELGKEATLSSILEYKPDVVIVATGSLPVLPGLPGIEVNRNRVVTAQDVLGDRVVVGQKVVVIGGGSVGCETADFLASKGKQVDVVEILENFAQDATLPVLPYLLSRLEDQGVRMFAGVKDEELTEKGLKFKDREGRSIFLEADTVISAIGTRPNDELFKLLQGKIPAVHAIGDCAQGRRMMDAIHEGAAIGEEI